jgi:cardiolipin synthase
VALLGAPPLPGNRLELLPNAEAAFPALLADIDRAAKPCYLEFYIWSPGGCADEVAKALIRAAARGVSCRAAPTSQTSSSARARWPIPRRGRHSNPRAARPPHGLATNRH